MLRFAIDADVPLNLAVVLLHPLAINRILSMPVGSVFPLRSQFAAMAKSEDERILRDEIGKLHGAVRPNRTVIPCLFIRHSHVPWVGRLRYDGGPLRLILRGSCFFSLRSLMASPHPSLTYLVTVLKRMAIVF
jgi:hypothetical protein